jgi:hypothetical protein
MTIKYPCNRCPSCAWEECSHENPYNSKTGYDCVHFATYVEQDYILRKNSYCKETKRKADND